MARHREIRIETTLWLTFLFCMCFLIVFFYLLMFEMVIMENFHYALFEDAWGAIVHFICSALGSCTILISGVLLHTAEEELETITEMDEEEEEVSEEQSARL